MSLAEAGAASERLDTNPANPKVSVPEEVNACCPVLLPDRLPPEPLRKAIAVLRRVLVAQALRELEHRP